MYQLIVITLICSNTDFQEKPIEFCRYFHQRGYPVSITDSALKKVTSLSREACIDSSNNRDQSNRPILVLTYHPFASKVKDIIYKHYDLLSSNRETNHLFQDLPLTAWRRDTNLKDKLVHTRERGVEVVAGSFPCDRSRCNTCRFIVNTDHVFGPKGSVVVTNRCIYTSVNIVYCISCLKCGFSYVGSTVRRLGDRFVEHLRLTRQNNHNYPVSLHFNTNNHSIADMSVSGICQVTGSEDQLRLKEEEIIFRLGTLEPRGMNKNFTSFPTI